MSAEVTKTFDPTVNFTVFGSWVHTMEILENEADKDCQAHQLFKAIANYCMYGEYPDFGSNVILKAVWPLIEREADNSLKRRKSNFAKDSFNENYKRIIETFIAHPEYSYSAIAELTGTNKSMVARVRRKFASTIDAAVDDLVARDDSADVGVDDDTGTTLQNNTKRDTEHQNGGCAYDPFRELDEDDGELPF